MRALLVAIVLLLTTAPVSAQDCAVLKVHALASGDGLRGIVPNPDTDEVSNLVPAGWVHLIFDASVQYPDPSETPASPVEVSLVKQIHWGPQNWWTQGVEQSARQTTPLGGWSWAFGYPLFAGERLGGRFSPMPGDYRVMYTGVAMPEACYWRMRGLTVVQPLAAGSIAPSAATVGQPVTFAATASGGVPPYQFKWWLWNGSTWTMVREWGAATWTWTPAVAGASFFVGVWVRDSTTTADTNAVNLSIPVTVQ